MGGGGVMRGVGGERKGKVEGQKDGGGRGGGGEKELYSVLTP